ncbi:hypothetical protein Pan153_23540 [Gimesia panareensis]|uniref:Uncharacterized protein n=1 Tax=Gimesia panareensis TaxID=2527978 RepID=A0A518FN05_9PLAN|nr:hypothetical protein [Gimesia panareensis]QDV17700.1 hypothetical protein Pan153_23540 [Gimesia panareensis]
MNKIESKKYFSTSENSFDDDFSCSHVQRNRLTHPEINPTLVYSPHQAAEKVKNDLKIAGLERKIAELEWEIKDLDQKYFELSSLLRGQPEIKKQDSDSDPKILSVISITEDLFEKSKIVVEREHDPDEEGSDFVIFNVSCQGDLKEILKKEKEWNRRVQEAESGHSGQLRLIVCPVE